MKRFLIVLLILGFTTLVFGAPSNTISIPNSFSPNTTIESSKVNSNNNEISTKYNNHTHTDITQLGSVTSGAWLATVVSPQYGGTGLDLSGASVGTIIIISSSTGTVGKLTPGTSGYFLRSNGSSQLPTYVAGGSADNKITRGFELTYATKNAATCAVSSGTLFHGSTYINKTASTTLTFVTASDWLNGVASSYAAATNWNYIGVSSAGAVKLLGNKAPNCADIAGNTQGTKLYYKNTNGTTSYYRVINAVKQNTSNKLAYATEQVGDWTVFSSPITDATIVLNGGTAVTPTKINCYSFVPAFSTMANFEIGMSAQDTIYLKPDIGGTGRSFFSTTGNSAFTNGELSNVRLNNDQSVSYKTTNGASAYIYISGYYLGNIR